MTVSLTTPLCVLYTSPPNKMEATTFSLTTSMSLLDTSVWEDQVTAL
jgi:hypothetical protein